MTTGGPTYVINHSQLLSNCMTKRALLTRYILSFSWRPLSSGNLAPSLEFGAQLGIGTRTILLLARSWYCRDDRVVEFSSTDWRIKTPNSYLTTCNMYWNRERKFGAQFGIRRPVWNSPSLELELGPHYYLHAHDIVETMEFLNSWARIEGLKRL